MNWADYLLSFLKLLVDLVVGIAWPAALLLIVCIFRDRIGSLWDRLTAIEAGGVKATFERGLDKAEQTVEQAKEAEGQPNPAAQYVAAQVAAPLTYAERILQLAELSPPAVIVAKWLEVDAALRMLAKQKGFDSGLGPYAIMKHLRAENVISPQTFDALNGLRQLRNLAQHTENRADVLTRVDADRFTEIANSVLGILSSSR